MYRSSLSLSLPSKRDREISKPYIFIQKLSTRIQFSPEKDKGISILEMSSSTEEEPNECKHYQAPCPERIAFFQVEVLVGLMRVLLGN